MAADNTATVEAIGERIIDAVGVLKEAAALVTSRGFGLLSPELQAQTLKALEAFVTHFGANVRESAATAAELAELADRAAGRLPADGLSGGGKVGIC